MERRVLCTVALGAGLSKPVTLVAVMTGLLLWVVARKECRTGLALTYLFLSLFLGVGRAELDKALEPEAVLKGTVKVEGVITESPRRWGNSAVFFFEVEKLEGDALQNPVKLLVQWRGCDQSPAPGDRWCLTGRYSQGERACYPGGFDQREWLWSQHSQGTLMVGKYHVAHYLGPPLGRSPHQLAYRARVWMMRRLGRVSHDEARALVVGVVFGETQSLPKDVQEQFRRTGTSHLLAASGMNVALLAGFILAAGGVFGFGPWRLAPVAIPPVIAYAFLAGCAPSISRAALGTTMALLALWWGRNSNATNSLCLSIWALLLWDPRQLSDLGFQLSVLAVLGLIWGPRAPEHWGFVRKSALLTLSASVVTLPLFWHSFGEVSATLLLSNLILGPVVELLFPLGLLASLTGFLPLMKVCGWLARLSLWLVEKLSTLADPVQLVNPGTLGWCLLGFALVVWLAPHPLERRFFALVPILFCFHISYERGHALHSVPGCLTVRKVGVRKPVYWLSHKEREILILSEPWQEKRALGMLRDLGCLHQPEIRLAPQECSWNSFSLTRVAPLLPEAPFVCLTVGKESYSQQCWWPEQVGKRIWERPG